jgi:stress response protein YsnF
MERDQNYNASNRLQELGGSDFEIVDNQPNIKGWTVKNQQGQTIGEVEELIFDAQARKVRYMVVDIEGSVLDLEPRDVLIPIGVAQLHEADDDVILPNVTVEQLRALPTYESGSLGREVESAVCSVFGSVGAAAAGAGAALTGSNRTGDADDFYSQSVFSDQSYRNRGTANDYTTDTNATRKDGDTVIPIIEENLEIGKREVETGGVHVSSRMVEQPVEEHVRLREERVFVERNTVDRPASEADLNAFKEGEVELTERAEVPVVNKEARVVEEITLDKEVEERDEVIRDTVRSTEVDVDNLNKDRTRLDNDATTDPDNDHDRRDLDNDRTTRI